MFKPLHRFIVGVSTLALVLAACAPASTPAPTQSSGGGGTAATSAPKATNTPAPTATPAGPKLGDERRLEEAGFAFREIPGYKINAEPDGFVTMQAADADDDTGPGIVILGGPNKNKVSIDAGFDVFAGQFTDMKILDKTDITLGGYKGLRYNFEATGGNGKAVRGRFFIVGSDDNSQLLMMLGIAAPDRWAEFDPFTTGVAESLAFFKVERAVEELRQWGAQGTTVEATAYTDSPFAAFRIGNALGAPNAGGCDDTAKQKSWEPLSGKETSVKIDFERPVTSKEINLHFLHQPELVSKVLVYNLFGEYVEVYNNTSTEEITTCPYVLTVPAEGIENAVAVEIIFDTERFGVDFAPNLDAVELVGELALPKPVEAGMIEQWGATADASSYFVGDPSLATGSQDAWRCGFAYRNYVYWSPEGTGNIEEWLQVNYETPVVPSTIVVYDVSEAHQIVKVEVQDTDGTWHEVATSTPDYNASCPSQWAVAVPSTITQKVTSVKLTFDLKTLNSLENIDAVKLIGTP